MLRTSVSALLLAALAAAPALAQQPEPAAKPAGGAADLAQQLANPVASLISVPVQTNYDWGWGADGDGFRFTANVQPVIPVSLNTDWNIISRTILPIIAQNDVSGPVTYGVLANHIWSFAGSSTRADVSATFVQPFFSYTTSSATTWGLNSETSYDWIGDNWLIPVNATVSQLVRIGKQPISIGGGVKYWIESPAGGPDWGLRLSVTLLFPK